MKDYSRLEQYCAHHGIPCKRGAPLREYCTFQIGGAADLLAEPGGEDGVEGILRIVREDETPFLVIGKGSNTLFSDKGYRGAVIHLGSSFSGMRLMDETAIDCDSGAPLVQLCLFAWEHGLSGLEFAYGIPGSVGGAIYMNAGAYGGEIKDVLSMARHICPREGKGSLAGEALALSYRRSAYTGGDRIITGGVFRLRKDDRDAIRARMDDYMGRRRAKQPLEYPSAGSTFKRPAGAYASALIDECGLKGKRIGGAMVSEKHAGFIVNVGGATCADVLALIAHVREEVQKRRGFTLECEVRIIG